MQIAKHLIQLRMCIVTWIVLSMFRKGWARTEGKTEDGKSVGRHDRLTEGKIKQLQKCYELAICQTLYQRQIHQLSYNITLYNFVSQVSANQRVRKLFKKVNLTKMESRKTEILQFIPSILHHDTQKNA